MYPREWFRQYSNADLSVERVVAGLPIIAGPIPEKCRHFADNEAPNGRCVKITCDLAHQGEVWWTTPEIDLERDMPGDSHTIGNIEIETLLEAPWGWVGEAHVKIQVVADGTVIWEREADVVGSWSRTRFAPKLDITMYRKVKFRIIESGVVRTPVSISIHAANFMVRITYDALVPPKKYDVTVSVFNVDTGVPVKGATVRLLRGYRVIGQCNTGLVGRCVIRNVPEGDYRLVVTAAGYEKVERAISVKGPTEVEVGLVPVPFELPWWLPLAAVAAAIVGFGSYAAYKKPEVVIKTGELVVPTARRAVKAATPVVKKVAKEVKEYAPVAKEKLIETVRAVREKLKRGEQVE